MSAQRLHNAASNLKEIVEGFDQSKPLLEDAYKILRPILDEALAGKLQAPGALPHRSFFFGMYEDSLPAHYLSDTRLMNALADFDEAWRQTHM
ncbi:hypothetical protein [Massilia sp. H6]|uniref:hypothetical protein n=1 Tax=Massilia sp. H6 TaxID=2970464 RepID=UPI0021675A80|nr:hypothetical protein [Massilia sp. H6]UVW27255.1 hypothetical protein NRS07_11840 [Massilia sp. H6]